MSILLCCHISVVSTFIGFEGEMEMEMRADARVDSSENKRPCCAFPFESILFAQQVCPWCGFDIISVLDGA